MSTNGPFRIRLRRSPPASDRFRPLGRRSSLAPSREATHRRYDDRDARRTLLRVDAAIESGSSSQPPASNQADQQGDGDDRGNHQYRKIDPRGIGLNVGDLR